jgi:hypothetical protein
MALQGLATTLVPHLLEDRAKYKITFFELKINSNKIKI